MQSIPESAVADFNEMLAIARRLAILPAIPESEPENVFYRGAREAAESEPAVFGTPNSVRWHFRNRKENGLIACGAVFERRDRPGQKKGTLIIDRNAWVRWMRGQGKGRGA